MNTPEGPLDISDEDVQKLQDLFSAMEELAKVKRERDALMEIFLDEKKTDKGE